MIIFALNPDNDFGVASTSETKNSACAMLILKTEHTNHLIIISAALIMHFSEFTNLLRIIQSKWVEKS